MSLHAVDDSISQRVCLCVCICVFVRVIPSPCVCVSILSVENVSVTTTAPPTPTTPHPTTSHPATPTLLTPAPAADSEGNTRTHARLFMLPSTVSLFVLCCSPSMSSRSLDSFQGSQVATARSLTHTHTLLLQPSCALHLQHISGRGLLSTFTFFCAKPLARFSPPHHQLF